MRNGKKVWTSFAVMLLAAGLSGCLSSSGPSLDDNGTTVTPTGGGSGGSSGGGSGGSSGGGSASGGPTTTTYEGFAAKAQGIANTDGNGNPTYLSNLQTDGPKGFTAQVRENSNGQVQSITANYGNQTATFSNCTSSGASVVCSNSSGENISVSNEGIGTANRQPNTYQYLSLGDWDKLPGNNASNAQLRVIYGVAGEKTMNMPTTGTANYKGTATMDVASNGRTGNDNPVTLDANVDLTANFGNKTISGSLNSFEDDDGNSVPGSVGLQSGSISGSTFSAGLSGNIGGESAQGSMKGMFYGPNADEVGGAFTLSNTAGTKKGFGQFAAKKQ